MTEPGEGKEKSEGTERLTEREDGDGDGHREKNSERGEEEGKREEGKKKRAVADGINFAWALLPSAGHREVVDRAAPNWTFQNSLTGRPVRIFSPSHGFTHPFTTSPHMSLRILGWAWPHSHSSSPDYRRLLPCLSLPEHSSSSLG